MADLPAEPPTYLDLVPQDVRQQVERLVKTDARREAIKELVKEEKETTDHTRLLIDMQRALPNGYLQEFEELNGRIDEGRARARKSYYALSGAITASEEDKEAKRRHEAPRPWEVRYQEQEGGRLHPDTLERRRRNDFWKAEKQRLRNDKPTRMWLREPRKRHVFHPHNVHQLT